MIVWPICSQQTCQRIGYRLIFLVGFVNYMMPMYKIGERPEYEAELSDFSPATLRYTKMDTEIRGKLLYQPWG